MSQNHGNAWTKWWWLRADHVTQWSVEERRAGGVLALTFAALLLFSLAATFVLLLVLHLGVTPSVAASILISVMLTFIFARGIANDMFPEIVQTGDALAAKRVCGWIPEGKYPFLWWLWWLEFRPTHRWSAEELWTRNAILALAAILFFASFVLGLQILRAFGIDERASAPILGFVGLPLALYLSRRFCVWMWPDYVNRADALARQRESQ
jgi:hypothetical protein